MQVSRRYRAAGGAAPGSGPLGPRARFCPAIGPDRARTAPAAETRHLPIGLGTISLHTDMGEIARLSRPGPPPRSTPPATCPEGPRDTLPKGPRAVSGRVRPAAVCTITCEGAIMLSSDPGTACHPWMTSAAGPNCGAGACPVPPKDARSSSDVACVAPPPQVAQELTIFLTGHDACCAVARA